MNSACKVCAHGRTDSIPGRAGAIFSPCPAAPARKTASAQPDHGAGTSPERRAVKRGWKQRRGVAPVPLNQVINDHECVPKRQKRMGDNQQIHVEFLPYCCSWGARQTSSLGRTGSQAVDATSISDRGLFRLLAGNLSPGVFRLLQHNRSRSRHGVDRNHSRIAPAWSKYV
jgi:hypothetical protein